MNTKKVLGGTALLLVLFGLAFGTAFSTTGTGTATSTVTAPDPVLVTAKVALPAAVEIGKSYWAVWEIENPNQFEMVFMIEGPWTFGTCDGLYFNVTADVVPNAFFEAKWIHQMFFNDNPVTLADLEAGVQLPGETTVILKMEMQIPTWTDILTSCTETTGFDVESQSQVTTIDIETDTIQLAGGEVLLFTFDWNAEAKPKN